MRIAGLVVTQHSASNGSMRVWSIVTTAMPALCDDSLMYRMNFMFFLQEGVGTSTPNGRLIFGRFVGSVDLNAN